MPGSMLARVAPPLSPEDRQAPVQVYDRVEIPPIKPDVTRVRLFGGRCACCGERAIASAPAGLEPGSPFGKSIEALVIYLHYAQAIGLERLRFVLAEIFGLSISERCIVQHPRPSQRAVEHRCKRHRRPGDCGRGDRQR